MPSKAKGSIQSQLKLEKAIINYDTNKMGNEVSFTDNPDVLLRMGEAYLDHDDTQNAQNVQTKLSGLSINKAKYLKALIKHKSASKSVDNAKKKLEDAEKADDKDKDNKNGKDKDNKDQNKDNKDDQQGSKEQGGQPRPSSLSPEQMERILEAMNNEERKTQDKVNGQKVRGQRAKSEKDW